MDYLVRHTLFIFILTREEDKNIFDYCRENNIDHISTVIKSKHVDVNMKDEEVWETSPIIIFYAFLFCPNAVFQMAGLGTTAQSTADFRENI